MKNIIIVLVITLIYFIAPSVSAEEILDFSQEIIIKEDASLSISETIIYDFGVKKKYGIFRDIPYKYKARGGNVRLRLRDIEVTDKQGAKLNFEISEQGDNKRIKIGEQNVLFSGQQTYVINYTIERAINFFSDYDELYWNVTGHGWPVKIRQSKVRVILPIKINDVDLKTECFSGALASTAECTYKRYIYEGADLVKEVIYIDDILQVGNGVTIVVGLPKGIVTEPSFFIKIFEILKDNWILFLPILVFIYMFRLWRKGRR